MAPASIRVLFPKRLPTTNPYLVMLGRALQEQPGVELVDLSWKSALYGSWDVLHLHWPEALMMGGSPTRRRAKEVAFAAVLARLRLRRQALVRTYHNVGLPPDITSSQARLLRRAESATALWIVLNDAALPATSAPVRLIPQGHYRSWYAPYRHEAVIPSRIGYFGLIRRNKALDVLIDAFREAAATRPDLTLSIAGQPHSSELIDELVERSEGDPRIEFRFDFLPEAELVAQVTASQLIALTHREMFNSSSALAALSLDRPVLLPTTRVNDELADEVGHDWVLRYDEPLTGPDLLTALARLDARPAGSAGPDLSRRDWDLAGQEHAEAYRAALQRVRSQ